MAGSYFISAARAVALFFGGFALLNVAADLRHPNFDANLWWIDMRPLPHLAGQIVLAMAGVLLLAYGLRPRAAQWRRLAGVLAVPFLIGVCGWNVIQYYVLLGGGQIAGLRLPLSALIALALLAIAIAMWINAAPARGFWGAALSGFTLLLCLVGFPVAQMVFFGHTDYRRPAAAAVVFGARAFADGTPSDALEDRVRAACELYQAGICHKLIFSGGPGDGPIDEPQAMRRLALKLGVKDADILCDPRGLSTADTVVQTGMILDRLRIRQVLAVSHFWHLPRIKMSFDRAGRQVYTVPVRRYLRSTPQCMAREVVALWWYYLRPLASAGGADKVGVVALVILTR